MREPPFWRREAGAAAALLAPAAALYGAAAAWRLTRKGRRVGVPVVCIGNPTVGGAGKTPLTLAVARMLTAAGERPVLLTRGYGGTLAGPIEVDPSRHLAKEVGDEPLLLARTAPTVVARDRVRGAAAAGKLSASVIVMDDGFQNPSLAKDFSVLVVDGQRGIGNGRVIPAGPLRAPLGTQLKRAHALVVVGAAAAAANAVVEAAEARGKPTFHARVVPDMSFVAALAGGRVLAFAGIGDPDKFFTTLADAGVVVAVSRAFADHHRYTKAEARALCAQADAEGLVLLTTEKDLTRMQGDSEAAALAVAAQALPVTLRLEQDNDFRVLLLDRLAAARR
jgi:tetraacyldisaccharide 4'-kinase